MLIPIPFLLKKFAIIPDGVIHIGAHKGEERDAYIEGNFTTIIWVEANPTLASELQERILSQPNQLSSELVLNFAASDVEGRNLQLKVSNNTQSSSLRDFGSHKLFYPEIEVVEELPVTTRRIDLVLNDHEDLASRITFANLDIQGSELEALRGFGSALKNVDWIYTEVNRNYVYKGNALVWEIDMFLLKEGFQRVETRWSEMEWGDAFYVRKIDLSTTKKIILYTRAILSWGLWSTINLMKYGKRRMIQIIKYLGH